MANDNKNTTYDVEFGKSNMEHFPLDKDLTNDTQNGIPKNTSKETIKKLGKYSKNLFTSTRKLTADIVGQYQPNLLLFNQSIADVAKIAQNDAKVRIQKMKEFANKNKSEDSKKTINDYMKLIETTKNEIVSRLKSGELYKNSADNISVDNVFSGLDLNAGLSDLETGDQISSYMYDDPQTVLSDEPFGDTYTAVGKRPVSTSNATSNKLSSKVSTPIINMGGSESGGVTLGDELISNITGDVGKAIIDQQNKLFEKNFAAAELRFTQKMEVQRGILSGVNATVEHLQKVEGLAASASLEYQGKMINFQQQQLGLLKEIKEATILGLPQAIGDQTTPTAMNKITKNGRLNAAEYYKNIKSNAKMMLNNSQAGMFLSMLPILGGANGSDKKSDPLSSMLKGIFKASMSSSTKAKFAMFDDIYKNAGSLLIGKMNDLSATSNNPFLKTIGKLFGVKDAYVKQADYGMNDPNKVVGWTAKSDRTLNEVIPDRLEEIVSALTGKEKEYYDYKTGQFVAVSTKQKEYQMARARAYSNPVIDNMTGNMAGSAVNNADSIAMEAFGAKSKDEMSKIITKDFKTIRMNIGKTNSMFNPARIESDSGYKKQLLAGITNPESLSLFVSQYLSLSSSDATNFMGQILSQNNKASKILQEFGQDALTYGGASAAGAVQNQDEADALQYELEHSTYYSDAEMKKLNPQARAFREKQKAEMEMKISRYKTNNKTKPSGAAFEAAASFGFGMPSGVGDAGGTANTLNNIFNLLANGIVVYPQRAKKLPPHIKAVQGMLKQSKIYNDELFKQQKESNQAEIDNYGKVTEDYNNAMRQRELMARLGPGAVLSNMLGISKEKNNAIDKGVNKGLDLMSTFLGVNFAGGVSNSPGNILDSEYGDILKTEPKGIFKDIGDAINKIKQEGANLVKSKTSSTSGHKSKPEEAASEEFAASVIEELSNENPEKPITKESLKNKLSVAAIKSGLAKTMDEAKSKVSNIADNIFSTVKKEKSQKPGESSEKNKTKAKDFSSFFSRILSSSADKHSGQTSSAVSTAVDKVKGTASNIFGSIGSAFSSAGGAIKGAVGNIDLKNPFKIRGPLGYLKDQIENVSNGKSIQMPHVPKFISKGMHRKANEFKQYAVDKFFTSKEVDMDKVEEEYRTAMSTYAALDEIEKSLSANPNNMKNMNIDSQIIKIIHKSIKSGTIDKDIGNDVIQGIKNYKTKGYPPLFALGKIKEAIKTKYDKNYKKTKRSNSAGAKVLKAIGKWTGTTVGGSYLIASGHPLMAAALIGNSLRTSPTFQNMMKKKYSNDSVMNSVADSLSNKSNSKYKDEISPFDKFLGITPMSRLTKEDLEHEEKIAASSFAAINEIEKNLVDKNISDKEKLKLITSSLQKSIKSGTIDKDIGDLVLNKVTEYSKKGRNPVEALTEAKTIIQKNYSKVIKKEKRKRSPASKILKGFGKGLGTTVGSSLLIASGHPLMAAALIGNSLRTSPTFQKMMKKKFDKKAVNNEIKDSLFGKATEKYGVEMSPFDKFLGINAMDKMTDKEIENEEKLAASSFAAINEIEKQVSKLNPADKNTPKTIEKMLRSSIKKNLIDKDIGEMVIKRIQDKVKNGGNPIEALTEAKETIQKNYSKTFKRQHRRRSKGSKILRGFGKGIGIGLTAMYNPALAAIMVGREIARHKSLKAAKEFGNDRDQINEIMGKDSLNENPKKAKAKGGFFSNLMDKFKNPNAQAQLDTDGDGNAEGTYNDQINDAKAEKEKKEKEKKEKEKVSLFTNISVTLGEIKHGLGIRDKGDDIDEKDDETIAGKMEQIRKETKKVKESVQDNTTATVMSAVKGGGRGKWAIFKDLVTVGGGVAVTASVAMNAVKAAQRAENEGGVGVASQLTGLDKSSESNYNYDGSKKQADFHLGGENGVDIDLDRGFERTHNGALIATNGKRWVDAGKRLAVDAKSKAGGFMAKFGKGAAKAAASGADDVAEAVVEKGGAAAIKKLPKTVLSKIKDGLTRFLSNKKVAKHITGKQAKGVIDTIMKKLSGTVPANAAKSAAKAGGKAAAKGGTKGGLSQIPIAGWIAAIVFVVWDFLNGMSKVRRYFKVGKNEEVTAGMRVTAGLVEAIPSLLGIIPVAGVFLSIAMSMLPPDWLTQNLYKLFVNKEAEEKLKAKQDAAVERAGKLGVDADRLNEYENRSWGQNFMDLFRSQKKEDERDAKLLGFETVEEYKAWQKEYDKVVASEKKANDERKKKEKEEKRKSNAMNSGSGAPASAAVAAYNKNSVSGPVSTSNYGPRTSSINAANQTATNNAWASQSNPTASPTAGYNFSNIKGPKAATEAFKNNRKAMQYQIEDAFNRSPSAAIAFGDQIADSRAKGQQTNINTLSPEFKKRVNAFLNDPRVKGQGVKIREGYRAPLTQYAYYSKGRSSKEVTDDLMKKAGFSAGINFWGKDFQKPGQYITWTLASNHFDGNAVDLEPGKVGYDKLGEIAKEYGIEWGGSWEKSPDRPHFEIDKSFKGKIPGVEDIETRTAPKSQYDIEFESASAQARTADGKVAPENESNKTTNPKVAKQVEEAKVKGTTPSYTVEYGVNGPSHGGASASKSAAPTGTKSSTSGGGGGSSSGGYKGSTTSNPATVKESPFVTNDKILVQEMQNMLKVQQAIKDEMVRHNGISEGFYNYIMDYFKKHTPSQSSKGNNNNYLYSNENESNDDYRFATSTEKLSKGLLG